MLVFYSQFYGSEKVAMLKEYCSVCNFEDDGFIGIKFQDGTPHVTFPRGYTLSDDDVSVRKDILGLITVLKRFSNGSGSHNRIGDGENSMSFPILSYQYVIKDFIAHGYYTERESINKLSKHGKISWKRTIQQIQPQVDNGNAIYLDFITRQSINKSTILTKIHEFCVYESFLKIGWLYLSTDYLPQKPSLPFNKKMFLATLTDALNNTFNIDKKRLFSSMIDIVNCVEEQANQTDYQLGVSHFEYVWENLIDYVFGESNKNIYFPRAKWHIVLGDYAVSSALEPDTIMILDGKFYILDAKYYKYGITRQFTHLPSTSSIQKQITYGEYIATQHFVENNDIYNAFVMPYAAKDGENPLQFVCVGTADWIEYSATTENYKYVLGILLDTKHIMQTYTRHNEKEIISMAQLIADSIQSYRENMAKTQ